MGSIVGGFLIGMGIMLLLVSSVGLYGVQAFYEPAYDEVMGYKESIRDLYELAHSPIAREMADGYKEVVNLVSMLNRALGAYRDLADLMPKLDPMLKSYAEIETLEPELQGMAENYAEAYLKIMEHKDDVEAFYGTTHSESYNETVKILKELSKYKDQPVVGALIGWAPVASQYMDEAREWSGMAYHAVETMEMLPPEKIDGYVSRMRLAIEAFPPEKASSYLSQAKELIRSLLPEKVEEYASRAEKAIEMLPPDRLDDHLSQAKAGSERAVEVVGILEAYPPQMIGQLLAVGAVMGASLTAGGVALVYRSRRR